MAVHFHEEDLPAGVFGDGPIAVDTETMGLITHRDRLCVVQLSDGSGDEHLVRFGPDSKLISSFTMTGPSPAALPDMMEKAVARMDRIYIDALASGVLKTDTYLVLEKPVEREDLPEETATDDPSCADCVRQVLHVRHHSLFTPRDFDVSPYFQVVKPTLEAGFDHHRLAWA